MKRYYAEVWAGQGHPKGRAEQPRSSKEGKPHDHIWQGCGKEALWEPEPGPHINCCCFAKFTQLTSEFTCGRWAVPSSWQLPTQCCCLSASPPKGLSSSKALAQPLHRTKLKCSRWDTPQGDSEITMDGGQWFNTPTSQPLGGRIRHELYIVSQSLVWLNLIHPHGNCPLIFSPLGFLPSVSFLIFLTCAPWHYLPNKSQFGQMCFSVSAFREEMPNPIPKEEGCPIKVVIGRSRGVGSGREC